MATRSPLALPTIGGYLIGAVADAVVRDSERQNPRPGLVPLNVVEVKEPQARLRDGRRGRKNSLLFLLQRARDACQTHRKNPHHRASGGGCVMEARPGVEPG